MVLMATGGMANEQEIGWLHFLQGNGSSGYRPTMSWLHCRVSQLSPRPVDMVSSEPHTCKLSPCPVDMVSSESGLDDI